MKDDRNAAADREFLAKARKLSPRFPTFLEQQERQRRRRRKMASLVAGGLLVFAGIVLARTAFEPAVVISLCGGVLIGLAMAGVL